MWHECCGTGPVAEHTCTLKGEPAVKRQSSCVALGEVKQRSCGR